MDRMHLKLIDIKSKVPRWNKSSILGKNKLYGFSANSVKTIHSKLNKRFSGLKFKPLNDQLFCFSKDI